tara:strand:+ start:6366 stop:7397 length:1032 start_codon:yes stop_codon:yes gene_type:complete
MGVIQVYPITEIEYEKYSDLNSYNIFNVYPSRSSTNSTSGSFFENEFGESIGTAVSYLDELFFELIKDKELILNKLVEIFRDKSNNFANEELFKKFLISKYLDYKITPPIKKIEDKEIFNRSLTNYWEIELILGSKDEFEDLFTYYIENTTDNLSIFLEKKFNGFINNHSAQINYKIKHLETKVRNLKEDNKLRDQREIAFLIEQSKIAKALNISRSTLETSSMNTDSFLIYDEQDYYTKGFIAIETEIENIKNRKDYSNNETDEIEKKIRELKQGSMRDKIIHEFESSRIASDEFIAVNYSTQNIRIVKLGLSTLNQILFSILFVIFTFLIIVCLKIIRRQL